MPNLQFTSNPLTQHYDIQDQITNWLRSQPNNIQKLLQTNHLWGLSSVDITQKTQTIDDCPICYEAVGASDACFIDIDEVNKKEGCFTCYHHDCLTRWFNTDSAIQGQSQAKSPLTNQMITPTNIIPLNQAMLSEVIGQLSTIKKELQAFLETKFTDRQTAIEAILKQKPLPYPELNGLIESIKQYQKHGVLDRRDRVVELLKERIRLLWDESDKSELTLSQHIVGLKYIEKFVCEKLEPQYQQLESEEIQKTTNIINIFTGQLSVLFGEDLSSSDFCIWLTYTFKEKINNSRPEKVCYCIDSIWNMLENPSQYPDQQDLIRDNTELTQTLLCNKEIFINTCMPTARELLKRNHTLAARNHMIGDAYHTISGYLTKYTQSAGDTFVMKYNQTTSEADDLISKSQTLHQAINEYYADKEKLTNLFNHEGNPLINALWLEHSQVFFKDCEDQLSKGQITHLSGLYDKVSTYLNNMNTWIDKGNHVFTDKHYKADWVSVLSTFFVYRLLQLAEPKTDDCIDEFVQQFTSMLILLEDMPRPGTDHSHEEFNTFDQLIRHILVRLPSSTESSRQKISQIELLSAMIKRLRYWLSKFGNDMLTSALSECTTPMPKFDMTFITTSYRFKNIITKLNDWSIAMDNTIQNLEAQQSKLQNQSSNLLAMLKEIKNKLKHKPIRPNIQFKYEQLIIHFNELEPSIMADLASTRCLLLDDRGQSLDKYFSQTRCNILPENTLEFTPDEAISKLSAQHQSLTALLTKVKLTEIQDFSKEVLDLIHSDDFLKSWLEKHDSISTQLDQPVSQLNQIDFHLALTDQLSLNIEVGKILMLAAQSESLELDLQTASTLCQRFFSQESSYETADQAIRLTDKHLKDYWQTLQAHLDFLQAFIDQLTISPPIPNTKQHFVVCLQESLGCCQLKFDDTEPSCSGAQALLNKLIQLQSSREMFHSMCHQRPIQSIVTRSVFDDYVDDIIDSDFETLLNQIKAGKYTSTIYKPCEADYAILLDFHYRFGLKVFPAHDNLWKEILKKTLRTSSIKSQSISDPHRETMEKRWPHLACYTFNSLFNSEKIFLALNQTSTPQQPFTSKAENLWTHCLKSSQYTNADFKAAQEAYPHRLMYHSQKSYYSIYNLIRYFLGNPHLMITPTAESLLRMKVLLFAVKLEETLEPVNKSYKHLTQHDDTISSLLKAAVDLVSDVSPGLPTTALDIKQIESRLSSLELSHQSYISFLSEFNTMSSTPANLPLLGPYSHIHNANDANTQACIKLFGQPLSKTSIQIFLDQARANSTDAHAFFSRCQALGFRFCLGTDSTIKPDNCPLAPQIQILMADSGLCFKEKLVKLNYCVANQKFKQSIIDSFDPYWQQLEAQATALRKRKRNKTLNHTAATTIDKLITECKQTLRSYLHDDSQEALDTCQQALSQLIGNASPTLRKHRGLKKILGNLCLFVLGLGVGTLVLCSAKACFTNHGFFFFQSTRSSMLIDKIKVHAAELSIQQQVNQWKSDLDCLSSHQSNQTEIISSLRDLTKKYIALGKRGCRSQCRRTEQACHSLQSLLNESIAAIKHHHNQGSSELSIQKLKQSLCSSIKKSMPILNQHRGFKRLLGNLTLLILGLGFGYLTACAIKKLSRPKSGFLFFNQTDSAQKLFLFHEAASTLKHSL